MSARVQLLRALVQHLEETDRILTNVAALVQRYGSEKTEVHRMGSRAHVRGMIRELEKDLDGIDAGWRKKGPPLPSDRARIEDGEPLT